jgi:hypothetical protein
MGYTHYWQFAKNLDKKDLAKFEKASRAISKACHVYNRECMSSERLSGYTAHTKVGQYNGILINGKKDRGHEDFAVPEKPANSGGFCKTARKPYDRAVVAALIIFQHYLGDKFSVESDGDRSEWLEGLLLARRVVPSANLPDSIRGSYLKVI